MEFVLYFLLFILFIYGVSIYTSIAKESQMGFMGISVSLLAILISLISMRYFDKMKEYESWIKNLNRIRHSIKVWTDNLNTLSGISWGNQLNWLAGQYAGDIESVCGFLPHKFFLIDLAPISEIPDKLGSENLSEYKGSIISVHNKINHLNFMIEKIHIREKLDPKEITEIRNLIDGNISLTVLSTLNSEFPVLKRKTEDLLRRLGEDFGN